MRTCIWLYGQKKTVWYKEGHTERLPGMFLPEKESFPESLQKTFFCLACCPIYCAAVQVKRSQLMVFRYNWTHFSITRLQRSTCTVLPWPPSDLRAQGRICHFCKVSRALRFPLCVVQTTLPQQMTAPFWSTFSTAADISAGCEYLVQFSPKSYEFWNTVTLQPWPRISTAFPKRYAHCAKKHLQSISLWYLLCKIKARGEKKNKQFLFCYSLVYASSQL